MSVINLDIKDFGPINNANLELKKLNIVAGINGSGKTTSSKLVYCILTSLSNEKEYLSNISIHEKFSKVMNDLLDEFEFEQELLLKLEKILNNFPNLNDSSYNEKLENFITSLKKIIDESKLNNKEKYMEQLTDIEHVLEINRADHRKFYDVSNVLLKSEFKIKDLKLENSTVHFNGKENDCEFSCELINNDTKFGFRITTGDSDCLNIENIIYIDSACIFDSDEIGNNLLLKNQPYHLRLLSRLLNIKKNNEDIYDSVFNQKLEEFEKKIAKLIGGHIFYDDEEEEFKFKKGEDEYSMKNTASGVKQLGILQRLLSNRALNENSFIIMDEPEVNIHPEWQVKFAELIVLMIKELDISIFINSHSPQFIEALEVYSAKYELSDETKFYLSKESESNAFDFDEISRDDLVILYNNLGNPYNIVNKVRAENMRNGIF
ncbi:AAA family ATPase [Methanobrevibacter sp.]